MGRWCIAALVFASLLVAPGTATASESDRDTWPVGTTQLTDSPVAQRRRVAIAVRDSHVYLVGGIKVESTGREWIKRDGAVLDLATKRWQHLPNLPFRRAVTTGAIWAGNRLVVTGDTCRGYVGDEDGCGGKKVAAIYSPRSRSWQSLRVSQRVVDPRSGGLAPLVASRNDVVFANPGLPAVAVNLSTERWRELPPELGWTNEPTCTSKEYAAFLGGAPPGAPNALHLVRPDAKRWSPDYAYEPPGLAPTPACSRNSVITTSFSAEACTPPCTAPDGTAFGRVQRFDLSTLQWSDVTPPQMPTGLAYYPIGHGDFVDFLAATPGPGVRLDLRSSTWTTIAPGPTFQMVPSALLWADGVAVIQDLDRIYIYRPL